MVNSSFLAVMRGKLILMTVDISLNIYNNDIKIDNVKVCQHISIEF
jgi:hypothetical protein